MNRIKISKESLLAIGFAECVNEPNKTYYFECDNLTIMFFIEHDVIELHQEDERIELDKFYYFIDEITTLLTGLTGKTDFNN